MKKLLLFALALPVFAQQTTPLSTPQPDCRVFFYMTAASSGAQAPLTPVNGANGVSLVIDNRAAACDGWTLTYSNFGFSVLSLLIQSAPNGSAALPSATGVPGTWAAFAGTIQAGSVNPSVSITQSEVKATGYFPFLRVNLTAKTGTGIIIGELHGWKSDSNLVSSSASSGCPGTVGTPCVVVGPTASGSPPTTAPVLAAGQDGTNVRTVLTDTAGRERVVGAAADGAAVVGDPVRIAGKDGSGNTQDVLTDTAGVLQNQPIGNGAVLSGQQAVTGSAVALATNTARTICVKALVSNTINVFVGPTGITTATGYLLAPGESVCSPVTNTNLVFVIASTTGASVSWFATN